MSIHEFLLPKVSYKKFLSRCEWRLISFISLFLLALPCFATVSQESIETAIKKTEEIIEAHLQNKRIPGCSIAVVYRNQVIYMKGFGFCKLGGEAKINPDTIFQLGSVSKPIAATLAVVVESKGLLNIDAPVTTYLPNFSLHTKQSSDVFTVKNVLTHTSGVPRGGFNNMIEHYATHQEIVHALQTARVTARVGHRYDYNNAMYSLISDIIQAATHQKFETALSTYLLTPLNMTRTSATLAGIAEGTNCAFPHTRNGKAGLCACGDYSKGYYAVAPAGGINSTARDMANFLKAQMGGYPKVVTPSALDRMQTPYTATNNLLGGMPGAAQRVKHPHYGLGWRIVEYAGEPLIFHGGWLRGFTNFVGFLPKDKLGIVILHNGDTKFSAKTAIKFFEVALGLPEIPETAKGSGKGKGKNKVNKGKVKGSGKAKTAAKQGKAKKSSSKAKR